MAKDWSYLIGQKFNKLTIAKILSTDKSGNRMVACKCECGGNNEASAIDVQRGRIKSCGCTNRWGRPQENHGLSHTRAYRSWCHMKDRCDNPNDKHYKDYGGRGISYQESWRLFSNFYADMGECPVGLSIDRIKNNENYTKNNCRWATDTEQAQNTTRTVNINIDGAVLCQAEWARRLDLKTSRLSEERIRYEYRLKLTKTNREQQQLTPKFKLPLELIVNVERTEP